MVYRIINHFLVNKINKKKNLILNILNKEIKENEGLLVKIKENTDSAIQIVYGGDSKSIEQNFDVVKKRLGMYEKYLQLLDIYKDSNKIKCSIYYNYYCYLKLIDCLYTTSDSAIKLGILSADPEIFVKLKIIEDRFEGGLN